MTANSKPDQDERAALRPEVVRVGVVKVMHGWSWSIARTDPRPETLLGAGLAPDRESAWADCAAVVNDIGEFRLASDERLACPACGGRNTSGGDWCKDCHKSFSPAPDDQELRSNDG